MRVGYSPDAFGHSGALPLILRGFGIDVAVVWRGFGGDPSQQGDLHRWRSADGSEVLMIHLPRAGYEHGASLPADRSALAERWGKLRALLEPRACSPHWLVLSGADHHVAQPDLAEVVEALRALAPDLDVRLGPLEGYADAVLAWSRDHADALPVATGELRAGHRHAWALQGTHGSRLYLKQANAACQRLLERYAEPLCALAAARGGPDRRAELRAAWRTLLENHPHDSICGTSADAVHREMMTRFARCRDEADEIVRGALCDVIGHDPAAARAAGREAWKPAVVVFNPSAVARGGVVEAEIAVFRADVVVGHGSRTRRPSPKKAAKVVLKDARGVAVPVQELERRVGHELVESPRHYPDCDEVVWHRVAILVPDVPPLGVAALALQEKGVEGSKVEELKVLGAVVVTADGLESGRLRVRVEPAGTIAVTDKTSGETYAGLGALVDNGDVGDSYTYSAPRPDRVLDKPDEVGVSVVHEGPLRGTLEIVRRYEAIDLLTRTRVTLEVGSAHLALEVTGENRRRDHRLRIRFPLGARPARVVADGHFGPVERAVGPVAKAPGQLETPAPTAPMQRYVTLAAGERGMTVLADGLPEYEARGDGAVLVTLLRAFGELSRAGLPERPGHAGWPTPTPDAQCLGPFTACLGLCFHDEAALDRMDRIDRAAEEFHAPIAAWMMRSALRLPESVAGPELVGGGLVLSAMRPAEEGRGIVVRCCNPGRTGVRGAWRIPWPVKRAERCRLDETPLEPLGVGNPSSVVFEAGPRAVVTILLR